MLTTVVLITIVVFLIHQNVQGCVGSITESCTMALTKNIPILKIPKEILCIAFFCKSSIHVTRKWIFVRSEYKLKINTVALYLWVNLYSGLCCIGHKFINIADLKRMTAVPNQSICWRFACISSPNDPFHWFMLPIRKGNTKDRYIGAKIHLTVDFCDGNRLFCLTSLNGKIGQIDPPAAGVK